MNFKQLSSQVPPALVQRAFQLYYKFLAQPVKISESDFIKKMDEFITQLEGLIDHG